MNFDHMVNCKITWQTKTIISPIPQRLHPPNLTGWWLTIRNSRSESHKTLWPCDIPRSRGNLKSLYLRYHSAHDNQTYLDGELPWGVSNQSYNTFIMWSCKVMRQTKTIIYPLSECLQPLNLEGWYIILRHSCP